jgi:hypothetical protein
MSRPSFRDRFFTPPVARAIMSPLGILLAGVGTAGAVLIGVGLPIALGVGVAAWAGRVLAAVPRGNRAASATGIDAYTLNDPWRAYVLAAQANRNRFERTIKAMRPGPLRDRLSGVSDRFEDAVNEGWRVATRGNDIEAALRTLDTRNAQLELAELQRQAPTPATRATVASLQAQLASANRMVSVATDARDHLRLLDARMDEMIARAAELSVTADGDVGSLGAEVDGLVNELEALRQAMEETGRAAGGALPGSDSNGTGGPGEQSGGWAMPSPGS